MEDMTSIEAIKRELIAEARRLDPADRSLKARASSLRQRWTGAGRIPQRSLDEQLRREFDDLIDAEFASRIAVPRDAGAVRALAKQLARDLNSWSAVVNETRHVDRVGLRRREESRISSNHLFDGYCLHSRRMHEAQYLQREGSPALSRTFEKDFQVWLRRDGELIAVEAAEHGVFPGSTFWTERTATAATDHDLADRDYLFRGRRITGPTTANEVIYEFQKWKDGPPWRLGLHIRDIIYNIERR
jgi:hypothetical protein